MRTEAEVRERLARIEYDVNEVRVAWRKAEDNPPVYDHIWNEDPQLLSGQITAIESAIEELSWVLEEPAPITVEVAPAQDIPDPNEPGPQRA
jgi:hypothetical protein